MVKQGGVGAGFSTPILRSGHIAEGIRSDFVQKPCTNLSIFEHSETRGALAFFSETRGQRGLRGVWPVARIGFNTAIHRFTHGTPPNLRCKLANPLPPPRSPSAALATAPSTRTSARLPQSDRWRRRRCLVHWSARRQCHQACGHRSGSTGPTGSSCRADSPLVPGYSFGSQD